MEHKMEINISQAKPGQYLTFLLKEQYYGVPIGTVREINRVCEITPVPQTPHYVVGVINLRGKVIPVIDLRLKFGVEDTAHTRQTCIIVIEGQNGQVGMIVDSVSEVLELKSEQIEPSPVLGDDAKLAFVIGMGKFDNRVIILINIVLALSKESLMDVVEKAAVAA